jgi:uncharacterized protein with PQ loop repeat
MDQTNAYHVKIGTILGYIAGSLVILSNLFQITKMIKDRSGLGLSPIYLMLFFVVCCLYISSGFLINIQFVYIVNIINISEIMAMLFLRFYFQRLNSQTYDVVDSVVIRKADFDLHKTSNIIPLLEYTTQKPVDIQNSECIVLAKNDYAKMNYKAEILSECSIKKRKVVSNSKKQIVTLEYVIPDISV